MKNIKSFKEHLVESNNESLCESNIDKEYDDYHDAMSKLYKALLKTDKKAASKFAEQWGEIENTVWAVMDPEHEG